MWQAYLFDMTTGQIAQQIDIPSFSWSMSVSDSAFTTTTGKEVGDDDLSGLELPWSQIPGDTPTAKASALQPHKRGLALFWLDDDAAAGSLGTPILAGALGVRTSSWEDVSVPYVSMLGMLDDRILCHEGGFGTGKNHTSPGSYTLENLSWRALACEVIRLCTECKPGGSLPIDLPWLGEKGTHSLPVEDAQDDKPAAKTKTRKRTTLSDGWVETVVDGDTTTVTEQHETKTTRKVTVTTPYTYTTKKKGKVTKTRTTEKTITTGRTVTSVKTVIKNHADWADKTVTTTVTTYTYDGDGNQTGSTTKTSSTTTVTARQTRVEYKDFNVANHKCSDILRRIASQDGGPDMQFRPYLTADQHIRFRFEAGSDGDAYLRQDTRLSLTASRYGATLENVRIDRCAPIMRVYATGAGSDSGTMCDLAEDLDLVSRSDPWPLRETTTAASDAKTWETLHSTAQGLLRANNRPLAQLSGEINVDDRDASGHPLHPLGSFWPGETFDIAMDGYPDWPDGVYTMRLMQMSGDETSKVTLKFDPIPDPTT